MDDHIIRFAEVLRHHGIRVSTAESIDALKAAGATGLGTRNAFKSALRATMVKRNSDLEAFNHLFDIYFSGIGNMVNQLGRASQGEMSDADFQEFLEEIAELLESGELQVSDVAQALLTQDSGALEQMLREMIDNGEISGNPMRPGAAQIRQLLQALGAGELAEEFDRVFEQAEQSGASEEALERLREYLDQRLEDLGKLLRGLLEIESEQREQSEKKKEEKERLLDKSFYYLSPSEIKKMREAVGSLARRLRNLMSIRYKHRKRGRLDVRRTLRSSMEFGGVPFKVIYDDRRKERPQVVILCDISDSVRNVSRFMLQFVHSLQDMYSRVRSYVFVAEIAEVSKLFKDNEIQSAIQQAINGNVVNVYAHSDFGRAFKNFHRDFIEAIDSRTTVIILGDARNNYNAPNEWVLAEIQNRAKQLIWLNPENRSTWGFGDSEMARYSKHCDMVEECRNLRQLYRVVDALVWS